MSNDSKKHHYVPQFYLKGFQNNDSDNVYALKKQWNGIKYWKTSQILYKEDLHTIRHHGEKSLMIEQFYSKIEGGFSEYLPILKDVCKHPDVLTELKSDREFNRIIKLMIATQFWRTPCKDELASTYSKKLVDLYDGAHDECKEILNYDRKYIKFLQKNHNKPAHFKIIHFVVLPLFTFDIFSDENNDFDFYPSKVDKLSKYITSDRPVLHDNIENLFSFSSFAFPLTKNLLVTSKMKSRKISISKFNQMMFNQADQIVIANTKEQLEELKSINTIESPKNT